MEKVTTHKFLSTVFSSKKIIALQLVLICITVSFTTSLFAQIETIKPASDPKKELEKDAPETEEFVYKWEGRPDPFMPFLTEKTVKAEMEAEEKELTGLQRYEAGQLTLVAIVFANDIPSAMVQDSIGKGYMIKKGTKIGKSGVVESITANEVLIKDERISPFNNKKTYKTIQMVLRKEGEK